MELEKHNWQDECKWCCLWSIIDHGTVWPSRNGYLLYSLVNEIYGEFFYKNLKSMNCWSRNTFYMRTSHVGKFNIILREILVGFQKANFPHGRTLCLPNTVYDNKMNRQTTSPLTFLGCCIWAMWDIWFVICPGIWGIWPIGWPWICPCNWPPICPGNCIRIWDGIWLGQATFDMDPDCICPGIPTICPTCSIQTSELWLPT